MEVNWDYRLDEDLHFEVSPEDDYEAWLDEHSDITCTGWLAPDDIIIPMSAEEWAAIYGSDLEEPSDLE